MSEQLHIEVEKRSGIGKGASRRLRAAGSIPAVLYGGDLEAVPIQVSASTLREHLRTGAGENAVFLLKLAGAKDERHAMIRALDVDPISRQILHVDFQRINLAEKIRVEVPIELVGSAVGVIRDGGVLDFVSREIEVECLPGDIPQSLEVDVTELEIGMHVEAKDVALPEGVVLMDEPEKVIVSLAHSRVALDVEELEEGGEEETLIEAEVAEPEVIGRGKEEEEEPGD
ncbi:MAG: 50S ribosomal protein L25 [Thermoanaerobaculia bacterium]|nr:50S ribosomal protein L25 [Thermoanaerobaculia bacterium]